MPVEHRMITLRKLRQLPAPTRLRKIVRLLDGFVQYRSRPDDTYLEDLVELVRTDPGVVEAGPGPKTT